jgi:hypothetical protein
LEEKIAAGHDIAGDGRCILVRVITPQSEIHRDKIIRATNNQNNIPAVFLRSTDKVHREIEEYLKSSGIFYERRKNFYRNAGKQRRSIVTIGELAQAGMAALLHKPSSARARPNSLIRKEEDYSVLFSESNPIQFYPKVIELLRGIEGQIKREFSTWGSREINNIKYHALTFFVVARLGKQASVAKKIADIAVTDEDELEAVVLRTNEIFNLLGGTDQTAKTPEFERSVVRVAQEISEGKRALFDKIAAMD